MNNQHDKSYLQEFVGIIFIILSSFLAGQILVFAINGLFGIEITEGISELSEIKSESKIRFLKFLQVISACFTFVIPPLIISRFLGKNFKSYMRLDINPKVRFYILSALFLLLMMPLLNLIIEWNQNFVFPSWLSELEASFIKSEELSQRLIKRFLSGTTYYELFINIVVIAIVPAIGEEFLFRGVLQRFIGEWTKKPDLAIFIAAFIFSAVHFQFYGFVPRLILGVYFGYLVLYSNSLWPAVFVHFLNNAMAVTAMFYINRGSISEDIDSFGTDKQDYIYVIISTLLLILVAYSMFKKKN